MIMLRLLEKIGDKTLALVKSFYNAVFFVAECFIHIINPKSYNPAMITVLIKQIYFTAVGILPLFITMSVLFGSIIIGVVISQASQYNLQDQIGSIIINFAVDEFSPFFTALLITLRSSTAVNAEIAVMKVNKELNTLKNEEELKGFKKEGLFGFLEYSLFKFEFKFFNFKKSYFLFFVLML